MNSYETETNEFRPRPLTGAVVAFGLLATLLADLVQSALRWAIETTLAWNSGWREVLILDVPVFAEAASPFYVSPPLGEPWTWAGQIVAGAFLVLAIGVIFFWPTRITLASRLFAHLFAILLLAKGVIGTALVASDGFRTADVQDQLGAVILIALAIGLLAAAQRRLLVVLQQFWTLQRPGERAKLLALLQLPGLTLLAVLYWLAGFPLGAVSLAVALLPIFLAQMRYTPRPIYERVTTHVLTGATWTVGTVVVLLAAASVWFFGAPAVEEIPRRAMTWSSVRGFELKTHETIFREQLRDPEGEKADEPMIRWSKDR